MYKRQAADRAVGTEVFDLSPYTEWSMGRLGKRALHQVSEALLKLSKHVEECLDPLVCCRTADGARAQIAERERLGRRAFVQTMPRAGRAAATWERYLLRNRYLPFFDSRRLNINAAPRAALMDTLPNCGETRVEMVLRERRRRPFTDFGDVERRLAENPDYHLGTRTWRSWAPFITFAGEGEAPDAALYGPPPEPPEPAV